MVEEIEGSLNDSFRVAYQITTNYYIPLNFVLLLVKFIVFSGRLPWFFIDFLLNFKIFDLNSFVYELDKVLRKFIKFENKGFWGC